MKKPAKKTAEKLKTPTRAAYMARSGAPFSNEDAQIIGPELMKIAVEQRVADVRMLDKQVVLQAVEANAHHPLRRFFTWDEADAAHGFRLEEARTLIKGVVIVYANLPARENIRPMFVSASA